MVHRKIHLFCGTAEVFATFFHPCFVSLSLPFSHFLLITVTFPLLSAEGEGGYFIRSQKSDHPRGTLFRRGLLFGDGALFGTGVYSNHVVVRLQRPKRSLFGLSLGMCFFWIYFFYIQRQLASQCSFNRRMMPTVPPKALSAYAQVWTPLFSPLP